MGSVIGKFIKFRCAIEGLGSVVGNFLKCLGFSSRKNISMYILRDSVLGKIIACRFKQKISRGFSIREKSGI